MKRLFLLLAMAGCASTASGHVTPKASAEPMAPAYHAATFCDRLGDDPVRVVVSGVGKTAGSGRAAALVRVLRIDRPRWNTPNGARPTKAQADAMTNPIADTHPWIYTPLEVRIVKVFKGVLPSRMLIYAGAGAIGQDSTSGCTFTLSRRALLIREGPEQVQVGEQYVAVLGGEMVTRALDGPIRMPVIDHFFAVHYGAVIGFSGKPEPLP